MSRICKDLYTKCQAKYAWECVCQKTNNVTFNADNAKSIDWQATNLEGNVDVPAAGEEATVKATCSAWHKIP